MPAYRRGAQPAMPTHSWRDGNYIRAELRGIVTDSTLLIVNRRQ